MTAANGITQIEAPKKLVLEKGSEILFKVKRIHGYHGTVIDASDTSAVVCRINEEALEGDIVVFPASDLVLVGNVSQLDTHHSSRLPWDYKS
jgi:hypothetical protein